MRAVAGTALDELLLDQLVPAIDDALPDDADSRVWLDEVAQPSLGMMRDFALRRVDDLVAGRPVDGDTLRAGLSLMIGKIVLNNGVVLADILLDHVTESVSDAARDRPTRCATTPTTRSRRPRRSSVARHRTPARRCSRELPPSFTAALSEATSDSPHRRAPGCRP
jgi:hypothetical protein